MKRKHKDVLVKVILYLNKSATMLTEFSYLTAGLPDSVL